MSMLVRFTNDSPTSTDQYDQVIQRLEADSEPWPPDGMEYHCAFLVDGNINVSEVWESEEKFRAFGERLMPILADTGIDPGQPAILEVHNTVKG